MDGGRSKAQGGEGHLIVAERDPLPAPVLIHPEQTCMAFPLQPSFHRKQEAPGLSGSSSSNVLVDVDDTVPSTELESTHQLVMVLVIATLEY